MNEQNEKQAIEEMARALCRVQEGGNNHIDKCSDCVCYGICIFIQEATRAYSVGYRKQIEAEWKKRTFIFFDSEKVGFTCSECNTTWSTATSFCPNCGAHMKGAE